MKQVRMFILKGCPYCRNALQWMEELMTQNPSYRDIPMEIIDESEHYALAKAHDYYLVPTWYVAGVKVHEGAASRDIVRSIFDKAVSS
jgi:thioredoxin 1